MDFTGYLVIFLVVIVVGGVIRLALQSRQEAQDHGGTTDLAELYREGWRTESETGTHVFLVKGQRVNHILHLLLCIPTFGLWLLVWLFVAASGGEQRRTVRKDSPESPSSDTTDRGSRT